MLPVQDQSEEVTVKHGKFRVSRRYDPSVRIPDVILKCVGFIGEIVYKDGVKQYGDLHATGFFVSVPSTSKHVIGCYSYFVTAKHVANDLKDRDIYFLVNKKGGGLLHLDPLTPWILHPTDETADIAIVSAQIDPRADSVAIAIEDFISNKDFESNAVGVGDEVFATGLFTEAPGTSRNLPIVRHGNLAMIPDEQIQTELGYADVYLVEARSIGGLSGSPVWVRPSLVVPMQRPNGEWLPTAIVGPGRFLGLSHGHWDVRECDINKPSITHDRKRGVNYGVAIVVPASKIEETINQPALVDIRNEMDEAMAKKSVPGMDSAKPRTGEREKVFTKADFEAALKKTARKIPSSR